LVEGAEIVAGYRDECFFRPGEEPIDRTFIEESGELSGSVSEFAAYRGEAEDDVEVVS
jgi:hypothetical protein